MTNSTLRARKCCDDIISVSVSDCIVLAATMPWYVLPPSLGKFLPNPYGDVISKIIITNSI